VRIRQLKLEGFKNYDKLNVGFNDQLICIVGLNGSGKTNLLDALHYLIFTKSGFGTSDHLNIKKSGHYFLVKGVIEEQDTTTELVSYLEKNQKKIFRKDNISYEKISDHIGQVLGVMSTPYDIEIIRGASEIRRKWIDGCISQLNPDYLTDLLSFQRQLKQRNALLKSMDGKASASSQKLLDTYDDVLVPLSLKIAQVRRDFLSEFIPYFSENLSILVQDHESCTIELKSKVLEADFETRFRANREKDMILQRTALGAHRDDFSFLMDDEPIKKFGSQGQQKSFLIALKLAQFDHLATKTGRTPLLLLDDIFDKLDDERISQLLTLLTGDNDNKESLISKGQVFITDARAERSRSLTKNIPNTQILEINEGKLVANEQ
jgi:DNA replication and repair protein RecF